MKLHNKKTGKVIDGFITTIQWNNKLCISHCGGQPLKDYDSLTELNEEWEDCKPVEPLIKDKNTRKAVRAWAYVNSIKTVIYCERPDKTLYVITNMGDDDHSIEFVGWIPTLKDGEEYTIADLCG